MGYFQNIETGIKLPLYVYSITNNFQKGIQYDKISTTDIQKAHRRCLCACACYSFGDAFELWAGLEVKEAKKEEEAEKPPEKEGVTKTPTKPNQEPEKDYLNSQTYKPASKGFDLSGYTRFRPSRTNLERLQRTFQIESKTSTS